MKKSIALILTIVALAGVADVGAAVGSKDVEAWEQENAAKIEAVENTAEMIGGALAPATGGWSAIIAKSIGIIFGAFFAINRSVAARDRGNALREIDRNPNTPTAASQAASFTAKKVIEKVTG
jgi:sugar phosphate permease